ncbi:MAG TPA: aminoglycoside phosphotransferase family protein [Fimbriimonas sp.]|nr:aminoglycoside phosphotransferase family protein [Fimbriimonas sp.]
MVPSEILHRVSNLLGGPVEPVSFPSGGYTPALRFVVARGESTFFVKVGVTEMTAAQLRVEIDNYHILKGSFVPELIAFDRDSDPPIMVIEDLSSATWPPPWTDDLVDKVVETIDELHQSDNHPKPLEWEPDDPADPFGGVADNWRGIAAAPEEFLSTGVATKAWLDHALPSLIAAEDMVSWTSENTFCHYDLRSDNLCITNRGVKFVDWNFCCHGNPQLDLGFFLPSLQFEGGPSPETILPGAPEVAATVAGFMALRAGQPIIPDAPRVRVVQYQQLTTALPWAARVLDLLPPDLL